MLTKASSNRKDIETIKKTTDLPNYSWIGVIDFL